ncbi:hypothetical protein MNBD_CHLOROFLEXI01-3587 [hydrothermal vent metagenome]|uniref:Uncharacterized protein n=1 Tax=hydrothermal vent metagenome TaxID=652676 RepID=A0A3B0VHJ6_9ZZZZ
MLKRLMQKKAVWIVMMLLGSLFIVTAVSADTLIGTGWVEASGNGVAGLKGNLDTLRISGSGVLYYWDGGETDIPEVTGVGRRIELPNGWVKWVGFNGTFSLDDADHVKVALHGRDIDLYAAGTGTVWLRGHGTYTFGSADGNIVRGAWDSPDSTNEMTLE